MILLVMKWNKINLRIWLLFDYENPQQMYIILWQVNNKDDCLNTCDFNHIQFSHLLLLSVTFVVIRYIWYTMKAMMNIYRSAFLFFNLSIFIYKTRTTLIVTIVTWSACGTVNSDCVLHSLIVMRWDHTCTRQQNCK